jgi:hypothetical protein
MTERADRIIRRTILSVLATLVLGPALVYAADDLLVRARREPTETVTVYVATKLKNGQLEIFYNQPVSETCVRSLFPHGGRRPCWDVRRSPLKVV